MAGEAPGVGTNEIGGETTSLIKTLVIGNLQLQQQFSSTYLQTLDRATMLGLQRSALPGTIAGLSTASHVPESNPYAPVASK